MYSINQDGLLTRTRKGFQMEMPMNRAELIAGYLLLTSAMLHKPCPILSEIRYQVAAEMDYKTFIEARSLVDFLVYPRF